MSDSNGQPPAKRYVIRTHDGTLVKANDSAAAYAEVLDAVDALPPGGNFLVTRVPA